MINVTIVVHGSRGSGKTTILNLCKKAVTAAGYVVGSRYEYADAEEVNVREKNAAELEYESWIKENKNAN